MNVILCSGRHHKAVSSKIIPDPNQLSLENFESVYDFLAALKDATNGWDKSVLMSAALDDKEDPEIMEVFELWVEQGLHNKNATMVFVDKKDAYKDQFYAAVAPKINAVYLSFDKVTIPRLEQVIYGEVTQDNSQFEKPPEVQPKVQPQPPKPPAPPKMPTPPQPPVPPPAPMKAPQPPAPPVAPPRPQPPVQQADNRSDIQRMVDEMRRRARTFIVTGERRSGVSGTVANMAMAAARMGISTLVIDMDIVRRGQYAYFPQNFSEFDTRFTHGLSNALRSYVTLDDVVWQIQAGLDVLGLDFAINDARQQETYADNEKLQYLLTAAKVKYDLTLVDMPFDKLKKYPSAITLAERSAYVLENDVMGLVNFLHTMVPDEFQATVDFQVFESRIGLLLNKVNQENQYLGTPITAKNIQEMLVDISDDTVYDDYQVLGSVPFVPNYGLQVDQKPLLTESSDDFLMLYFKILYNMYR